ncbi:hypothetical protein jhhlp_003053 [Lomentospora prolificans]|uniref:Xylanolytic transcriptional activator regulatory domain-containing protein n=1 Tax=Lomentospora prolificans TaxID=41688 RepID=A0A2N3NFV8_9PEZI|nr:hypothetical protein jhhlp_003053 [Lomentospora prolificans]
MKHRIKQLEQALSLANAKPTTAACEPGADSHSTTSFLAGTFHVQHEGRLFGSADVTSRSVMHKSRLFGRSHWINGVVLWFKEVFETIEPLALMENSKAFATMRKCKSLARVVKARRTPPWPLEPTPDLPPKEVADDLVNRYLETLETVFRVLHIPTFKRDYAAVWEPGAKPDPAFLVQLKLVLAIGATSHDTTFSLRPLALRWIYEAHTWMSPPEFKRKYTVQSLQTYILLILAREFVGVDEGSLWVTLGMLIRAAMYMGLHRDPSYLPKRSLFAAEMRRRLWNTVIELAAWTSLNLGGPPFLSPEDFDTQPPGNFDDDQLNSENPTPKPGDHFTQSSVAIALRESFPARMAILKFLNELASTGEYEEALRLDSKLRNAYKTLGHSLRVRNSDKGNGPPEFAARMTDVMMNRYFLSLHVPFFSPQFSQMSFAFSRKVVGESSLRIWYALIQPGSHARALEPSVVPENPWELEDNLKRLTICASGAFRMTAKYASLLIAAELKMQLREDDSLSRPPLRRDLLAIVQDTKGWTKRAIEAGETNIKGYIFATMVNIELDCIIQGVEKNELAQRLIKAVEEAEEVCLSTLENMLSAGQPEGAVDGGIEHMTLATPPDLMEMEDWDFSLLDTQFNVLGSPEPTAWVFGAPQELPRW